MPPRLRLFIAIDPPAETAAHARRIIERLRRTGVEATWADPAQLHLTLHFLGNGIDEADLHPICRAMDQAGAGIAPFEIECGGVGAFPDAANPRTIWIGIRQGAEPLIRLHEALAAVLEPLGYPAEERRYRPHITLGRVRRDKGRDRAGPEASRDLLAEIDRLADLPAGGVEVGSVELYASRLDRDGAVYDRLHTAELRGR